MNQNKQSSQNRQTKQKFRLKQSQAISKVMAFVLAIFVMAMTVNPVTVKAQSNGFYVNGTTIYDANGNPFVMRGINLLHAWHTDKTESSIRAIASTGANTIRFVASNGRKYGKTSKTELMNIVNWCKDNKIVCILEVHDATGSNDVNELKLAVDYWIEMADVLKGNEKYVILNIANEWYGEWNGANWAEGYKAQISRLRDAGIENMLIVDCAGWGQYPDSILYYGKSVFNADRLKNLAFSIHMYEYAGKNETVVKSNIDNALSIGVPVIIGEFAHEHTDGDVDEETIINYCNEKNVGYLGWSWIGNNENYAFLDIPKDWEGASLWPWGDRLINGTNGIRQTSRRCTVYGDSYISLFWGEKSAQPWKQAVSVPTAKNGGDFSGAQITPGGYFYVEYSGTNTVPELNLQSWSGGTEWAVVPSSETGQANGHNFAKYSYQNCVNAFGSDNFEGLLDQIHAGASSEAVTIYSVCYCN